MEKYPEVGDIWLWTTRRKHYLILSVPEDKNDAYDVLDLHTGITTQKWMSNSFWKKIT